MNVKKFFIIKKYRQVLDYLKFFSIRRKKFNIPTIISRDCCGGVIYKRLKLQFCSPTIGLNISKDEFICFCTYLKNFIEADLIECVEKNQNYPVGKLVTEYGTVHLHFMHYHSFEEAFEAWNRRKKRVNYDNLFILMNAGANVDKGLAEQFLSLPYKRKALLSSGLENREGCYNLPCYENGFEGPLVKYCNNLTSRRYLDEYDWKEIFIMENE